MNAAFIAFTFTIQLRQRCNHPQALSKPRTGIRIFVSFMQTAFGSQLRRGKWILMIYIRRLIFGALSCILIGGLSAADTIRINIRQSDEAVRQRLLELPR